MVSISVTDPTTDGNGPLSVVGYGHSVFSFESDFIENAFIIECHDQTDGLCPEKVPSFPAFASIENVQDWAAIFTYVEKWVNNFKRI